MFHCLDIGVYWAGALITANTVYAIDSQEKDIVTLIFVIFNVCTQASTSGEQSAEAGSSKDNGKREEKHIMPRKEVDLQFN